MNYGKWRMDHGGGGMAKQDVLHVGVCKLGQRSAGPGLYSVRRKDPRLT